MMRHRGQARLLPAVSYRLPLPVTEHRHYGDSSYAVCPRCSISLERDYVAYCDRCGQRLDWHVYSDAAPDYEQR